MGLKLMKSLLASTVLLIGMSGTAMGGECDDVLEKMQDIFDKREKGDITAGTVAPKSLLSLPIDRNVSVHESRNSLVTIPIKGKGTGYCFKLSGHWSKYPDKDTPFYQAGQDIYPHIRAYIFFNEYQTVDKIDKNLFVDSTLQNVGKNRYIGLTSEAKGKKYAIAGAEQDIKEIKENIIWLDEESGKPDLVEVVLCEGRCRSISDYYKTTTGDTKPEFIYSMDLNELTEATEEQLEETRKKLEEKIKTELREEFSSKRQEISKEAINNFMVSDTIFKFVDKGGNELKLNRKDLVTKECTLPEVEELLTQKSLSTFIYGNCISVNGYKVKKSKIQLEGKTLTVTFTLKKLKPAKFSEIKVIVEMADLSTVTNACTLQAIIVDTTTNDIVSEEITFPSTSSKPIQHTFHLKLNEPIAWKSNDLILRKLEGADCQPEGGEFRITLTQKEITYYGALKLQNTIKLHSTLGKALLVLNTMIGEKPDGSDSSTQFYPIEDDESTKKIYREIITQSLNNLHGKVDGFTVVFSRPHGKVELKEYPGNIEKTELPVIAEEIVEQAVFIDGNFVWNPILKKIYRELKEPDHYTYRIFIGQSGLSYDKSYCENHPRKDALKDQKVNTFIYDFATIGNTDNPKESDLSGNLRAFPHKQCDDKYRHIVLFPEARKAGWENAISILLSTAF